MLDNAALNAAAMIASEWANIADQSTPSLETPQTQCWLFDATESKKFMFHMIKLARTSSLFGSAAKLLLLFGTLFGAQ
jgi:hypothetical protein